jgi:hypothetical protein
MKVWGETMGRLETALRQEDHGEALDRIFKEIDENKSEERFEATLDHPAYTTMWRELLQKIPRSARAESHQPSDVKTHSLAFDSDKEVHCTCNGWRMSINTDLTEATIPEIKQFLLWMYYKHVEDLF